MKRRQWFEFHELPGCPDVLRRLVTGYLEMVAALFRPFSLGVDSLARAMRSTGTDRFVDLCSGNGGPWFHLARRIEERAAKPVSVVLTDRFPSPEAARRSESVAGLTYLDQPVDARCVPEMLEGVRTLFNGLHHFPPNEARAILADAVAKGQPIAVFEMLQRNWLTLLRAVLLPISMPVLTPLVRPLSWSRLLLTYVIPLAPLLLLWDGVVSVLRCYRPEELQTMVDGLDGPPFTWETGTYQHHTAAVTYIVGYPQKDANGLEMPTGESRASGSTHRFLYQAHLVSVTRPTLYVSWIEHDDSGRQTA